MAKAAGSARFARADVMAQGVRFVLAGCVVALVYLLTTLLLSLVVGLPFQLALIIGFSVAVVSHFSLQRLFVWTQHEEYALPFSHQVGRYLLLVGAQYGVTALSTALLPAALGVPTEVVYLVVVLIVNSTNFLVFRNGIFHSREPEHRT